MRRVAIVALLLGAVAASAAPENNLGDSDDVDIFADDTVDDSPSGEEEADAADVLASNPHLSKLNVANTQQPVDLMHLATEYKYETVALVAVLLYLLNFVVGRARNQSIANAWFSAHRDTLERHFASVSIGADPGSPFLKESQSEFKLFASGRRYCDGALVTLQLKRRQDLLARVLSIVYPEEDLVTIDIPLQPAVAKPFVIAVCRRRRHKAVQTELRDVRDYARLIAPGDAPAGFPKSLVALSDAKEALCAVLQPSSVAALAKHADLVRVLHITDQRPRTRMGTLSIGDAALRFQFHVPPAGEMHRLEELVSVALDLIDVVPNVHLSAATKQKAEAARNAVKQREYREAHEARQELAQQKKQQKEQDEDEKLAKMTPEERRKWKERNDKKLQRRRMKKMAGKIKMR